MTERAAAHRNSERDAGGTICIDLEGARVSSPRSISHSSRLPLGLPQRSQQLLGYMGLAHKALALRPVHPDGSRDFSATMTLKRMSLWHLRTSPIASCDFCSQEVVTSVQMNRTESLSFAVRSGSSRVAGPVGASPTETHAVSAGEQSRSSPPQARREFCSCRLKP